MGIIEKVPLNQNIEPGTIHYLPHRAVIKSERETTEIRVVFDASSEQSDEPFLNDLLYARPCLCQNFIKFFCVFDMERLHLSQILNKHFFKSKLISLIEIFYDSCGTIL